MIRLKAKPHDDLNWHIEGEVQVFEFELGLNEPYFPLEDELHFQTLALSLSYFAKEVFPRYPNSRAILYRGSANFSSFFRWSELQENNYEEWKKERPSLNEEHLKRLFCAESFVAYFQMLAHKLPDEMPIQLVLETKNTGMLAETLHLLSPERFSHFELETGLNISSKKGICFPGDEQCTEEILKRIDELLKKGSFKPVYEPNLTEQWDGLDEIYIFPEALTSQGKRKLMGFTAAGGEVIPLG